MPDIAEGADGSLLGVIPGRFWEGRVSRLGEAVTGWSCSRLLAGIARVAADHSVSHLRTRCL